MACVGGLAFLTRVYILGYSVPPVVFFSGFCSLIPASPSRLFVTEAQANTAKNRVDFKRLQVSSYKTTGVLATGPTRLP